MIPKYLYHYTSIDTLKTILIEKTFKFSRLDIMNDPLEGVIKLSGNDVNINARKLVFCSCWSSDPNESISMWGIYNRFKGVRIKARSDMFADFCNLYECNMGFIPYGNIIPIKCGKRATIDNRDIMINKIYGPMKIDYFSSEELGKSIVYYDSIGLSENEPQIAVNIVDLGNQKNKYWEYEKEWRYKLSAFSKEVSKESSILQTTDDNEDYDALYVPFKRDLEEILLGPEVEVNDFEALMDFLKNKGITIPVKRSKIRIRSRV